MKVGARVGVRVAAVAKMAADDGLVGLAAVFMTRLGVCCGVVGWISCGVSVLDIGTSDGLV